MFKVKQILSDLIDQTYEGNEKLDAYKRFYVELINEERKSFHGDYHIKTHRIRIFNLYRDEAAIVATTIHEVAHHIDAVNRGEYTTIVPAELLEWHTPKFIQKLKNTKNKGKEA